MQETQYKNPLKVYVAVTVRYDENGTMTPLSFEWEDGQRYEIDKVLDVRQAASLRAGGCGLRYTCYLYGKEAYLFLEENRWFMERKPQNASTDSL